MPAQKIRLKGVSQNSVFQEIVTDFENHLKHQLKPNHFIFEVQQLRSEQMVLIDVDFKRARKLGLMRIRLAVEK